MLLAGVLGFCFLGIVLVHGYWYSASFMEVTQQLPKEAVLLAIKAAMHVYDPYRPQLARLGPEDHSLSDLKHYRRIEEVLPSAPTAHSSQGKQVVLTREHNARIVRSSYTFRYQPYNEPILHQLRSKYRLDEVVAGAADEFEAMVRLRNWSRSQFRRHDYQPVTTNFNALEVLDRNLRNRAGEPFQSSKHMDPCKFFPLLYCQLLLSLGHQARLASIGHGTCEVWSNQYAKWVVMDAELNHHYEKHGIPLNMVEMLEENYAEPPSGVRIVRGEQSSGDVNTTMVHLKVEALPVEHMIRVHRVPLELAERRNDWLTNRYFPGHPARSEENSLIYIDPRLPVTKEFKHRLRPHTRNKHDMYWTLNQAEILVHQAVKADVLQLAFQTVTPNYDSFEITVDGAPPLRIAASTFTWRLHAGVNTLAVRPVNQFGVKGVISSAEVLVVNSHP
jgi:hypothetical protein